MIDDVCRIETPWSLIKKFRTVPESMTPIERLHAVIFADDEELAAGMPANAPTDSLDASEDHGGI